MQINKNKQKGQKLKILHRYKNRERIYKNSPISKLFSILRSHGFYLMKVSFLFWTFWFIRPFIFRNFSCSGQKYHLPPCKSSFSDLNCPIAFFIRLELHFYFGCGSKQARHRRIPLKFRWDQFSSWNWVGWRSRQIHQNRTRLRVRFR